MIIEADKKRVILRKYAEFSLVYNVNTNTYVKINDMGYEIINYVIHKSPLHLTEILEYISRIYDISEEDKTDVSNFILSLVDEGILESKDVPAITNIDLAEIDGNFEKDLKDYMSNNNILFTATFEMTYTCNERCIHCYACDGYDDTRELLSTAEIKHAIDELYDMNCFHIVFTGGDPFMRKDFMEVYEYAINKNFSVDIYTNGLAMADNEELLNAVIRNHPKGVYISFYSSNPTIHEKITQIKGSYIKTLYTIKKLQENNISTILNILVMKDNIATLSETVDFVKKLNSQYRIGWSIAETNTGKDIPLQYRLDNEQQTVDMFRIVGFDNKEITPVNSTDYICGTGTSSLAITPYGDVKNCILFNQSWGNIKEENLYNIWEQEERKHFINSLIWGNAEKCNKCLNKSFCPRCLAHSYNQTGNPFEPNDNDCYFANCLSKLLITQ